MCDLGAAWAAVHENIPDGWYVAEPGYEERYDQWTMYAFDPCDKPVVGKRSREWAAVGRTELQCVQVMARCLGDLMEGGGRSIRSVRLLTSPRRRRD